MKLRQIKDVLTCVRWNVQRAIKRLRGKKISVVFLCHRPEVWGSLESVFEACNADKDCNVTIVPIPNKKQLPGKNFSHEIYEDEGAEIFFKSFPCRVINGYNHETKQWLDIRILKPDYVFFQQPYDVMRPYTYKSSQVMRYAKVCYVNYYALSANYFLFKECMPNDFLRSISLFFAQNPLEEEYIKKLISEVKKCRVRVKMTGFPRFDKLERYRMKCSNNWNLPRKAGTKRILWTPRWTTSENACNFFDYKDKLLSYIALNQDVDFIFRPHPQAFLEWAATGELSADKAKEYKGQYEQLRNAKIDQQKEYLTTFYSSDILVTDISSIITEYFLTGNPIIYCHKTDLFNNFSRKLSEGFYWVHNWDELKSTLNMLRTGDDPLYEKRQRIIKETYYINAHGAGMTIKDIIKKDFYGQD